jgi:hypothetical protein
MRRALAIVIAGLAAFALAAPAAGVTPTERKLQRQVKALQKQVKTLQTQMRQVQVVLGANIIREDCTLAAAADAFQGTWNVINQQAQASGRPAPFAQQTPISDTGSCQRLRITRSQAVPPNVAVFSSLVQVFEG